MILLIIIRLSLFCQEPAWWASLTRQSRTGRVLTLDVAVAEEVNSLGVYAVRLTSVAASLGSSSNVTPSGTKLSDGNGKIRFRNPTIVTGRFSRPGRF